MHWRASGLAGRWRGRGRSILFDAPAASATLHERASGTVRFWDAYRLTEIVRGQTNVEEVDF